MHSLDQFAAEKLAELDREHLRRVLVNTQRHGIQVERNGRRLISFSCNDYLGLTHHPAVQNAAIEAVRRYGVGAGASRLVTGNHPLYGELESRLARLKETEAACVFGSGYLTNSGVIPALIGSGDLVLIDELAHACLWSGARLTRGTVLAFRHNDVADLESLLSENRARHVRVLIATEGVFSMDGDVAPLAAMAALAQRFDAWLLVDDAHGVGVLGDGRGSGFVNGSRAEIPLQVGTLSKALGGYGGYVCGSRAVIDLIKNRARSLIYSTGLPPTVLAAAIAALDIVEADPERVASPLQKARLFTRTASLPEAQSAIVPVIIGEAAAALDAARMLEREGFLVVAIRPPTVPPGTARLRLTFSSEHPDEDIKRLAGLIRASILDRAA
jgi:8-amino-7-oxononanoate synthase